MDFPWHTHHTLSPFIRQEFRGICNMIVTKLVTFSKRPVFLHNMLGKTEKRATRGERKKGEEMLRGLRKYAKKNLRHG